MTASHTTTVDSTRIPAQRPLESVSRQDSYSRLYRRRQVLGEMGVADRSSLYWPYKLDESSTSALGTEEQPEEVSDRGGAVSDDELAQSALEWRGSREQTDDGTGGEQCQPDQDG